MLPVLIKEPGIHQITGPFPFGTWGRGYACKSTSSGLSWLPSKNIKHYFSCANTNSPPINQNPPESNTDIPKDQTNTVWRWRCHRPPRQFPASHPITRSLTGNNAKHGDTQEMSGLNLDEFSFSPLSDLLCPLLILVSKFSFF